MIGKWMETLNSASLERIADAAPDKWVSNRFRHGDGCGCLAHHSGDLYAPLGGQWLWGIPTTNEFRLLHHPIFGIDGSYERLCDRYDRESRFTYDPESKKVAPTTPPRVVRMIQNRARKILAQRKLSTMQHVARAHTTESAVKEI